MMYTAIYMALSYNSLCREENFMILQSDLGLKVYWSVNEKNKVMHREICWVLLYRWS